MKKIFKIILLGFLLVGCTHVSNKSTNSTPKTESEILEKASFNSVAYHYTRNYKKYNGFGETEDLAKNSALDNCYKNHRYSPNFCKVYSFTNKKLEKEFIIGPKPGQYIAANARSCFKINEKLDDTNKICSYNCTGNIITKDIKSSKICEIFIEG